MFGNNPNPYGSLGNLKLDELDPNLQGKIGVPTVGTPVNEITPPTAELSMPKAAPALGTEELHPLNVEAPGGDAGMSLKEGAGKFMQAYGAFKSWKGQKDAKEQEKLAKALAASRTVQPGRLPGGF